MKAKPGATLAKVSVKVHFCWADGDVTSIGTPLVNQSVTAVGRSVDQWKFDSVQHDESYEDSLFGKEGVVTTITTFKQFKDATVPVAGVPLPIPEHTARVTITLRLQGDGKFVATGGTDK